MRLTHLEIKGFRSLYDVSIEMRPLMVLIGPNGSGKTSFLDVLRMLRAAAKGNLSDVISEHGGVSSLLSRTAPFKDVEISCKCIDDLSGTEFSYGLALASKGVAYRIAKEQLVSRTLDSEDEETEVLIAERSQSPQVLPQLARRPDRTQKPLELQDVPLGEAALSTQRLGGGASNLRRMLAGIDYLHPIDVSARSPIRLPQDLAPGLYPYASGERLFASLYNMRIEHPESLERILDVLRVAMPEFERIEFPVVASGKASLFWYEKKAARPFEQGELSEGTLRFLWLVTTLLSPESPSIMLIDEPEMSLHPQLLMLLADVLKEAALASQVIVATHSDRLIRWLEPENVAVVDKEDGLSKIEWLPTERLKDWLTEYTLDQLWINGELGGRS
jgi:predicted ATPase